MEPHELRNAVSRGVEPIQEHRRLLCLIAMYLITARSGCTPVLVTILNIPLEVVVQGFVPPRIKSRVDTNGVQVSRTQTYDA